MSQEIFEAVGCIVKTISSCPVFGGMGENILSGYEKFPPKMLGINIIQYPYEDLYS